MKTRLFASFIAALIFFLISTSGALAATAPSTMGNFIVVFFDTVTDPATLAAQQVKESGGKLGFVYQSALKGYSASLPVANVPTVQADPNVDYVMADRDRAVAISAQTLPTGVDRIDGDLSSTISGNGGGSVDVDVAVIDTGISLSNPDLNVVGGRDCVTPSTPTLDDPNGHGTNMAGTIAARDDTQGVVGVAPGARLWSVRVADADGFATFAQAICGIDFVTANAATIDVANISLEGSGTDPGSGCRNREAFHDAICSSVKAGVTYTVAAGNGSHDASTTIPAAYDEVITVSGLADFDGKPGGLAAPTCQFDGDDTFYNQSNFGRDVDYIAPALCILTDAPGVDPITGLPNLTTFTAGTSIASAHVAGAAALYKSTHPSATPNQVRHGLESAGDLNWDNADDPDGIKETLVNVDAF